jgi:putative alpha-1,2-mannosidase
VSKGYEDGDVLIVVNPGNTQGGSNADIVIVDAYLKNITAGIDWNLAYEALIKDAEEEPPNWDVEGKSYFVQPQCTGL